MMQCRIPTNVEWNKMVELTRGAEKKIHWTDMYTWVHGPQDGHKTPSYCRVVRGFFSPRFYMNGEAVGRFVYVGFRPTVDIAALDPKYAKLKEGKSDVIGTLFMAGRPVRVPEQTAWNGDVTEYIPNSIIEMREPLDDPAYQITGIRVGDAMVADRCVLTNISYLAAEMALSAGLEAA